MSAPFKLGSAVFNGVLQYVSPSSIKTFKACPRSWWLRYVAGIKAPTSKAQQAGIDGHARIEHYLRTGEDVLTPIEQPGRVWIPKPGEVAAIEARAEPGKGSPEIAGVPVVHIIDCLNTGYYVDPQGEVHAEEFPEVLDWKFSGNPRRWGMSAQKIRMDLAMACYAVWAVNFLNISHKQVRVSHVYFARCGTPDAFKRSAVADLDHFRAILREHAPIVEEMKRVASVGTVEDTECNLDACDNYDGCYYGKNLHCPRSTDDVMRSMFDNTTTTTTTTEQPKMGLLDAMEQPKEMDDRLAALKAEEEAAKATAANVDPATAAAIDSIEAAGFGWPMFKGEAASLVADHKGFEFKGDALAGTGRLAPITIETAEKIQELAAELAGLKTPEPAAPAAPTPPAEPPQVNPPDAPPLNVASAAVPVEPGETLNMAPAIQKAVEAHQAAADATPQGGASSPQPPADPPAEKPKKAGRPRTRSEWAKLKKAELVAELDRRDEEGDFDPDRADVKDEITRLKAENESLRAAARVVATEGAAPVEVWIDCLPVGQSTESFDRYASALVDSIAARAGVPHILAAGEKSPLAFGKWEGFLVAAVRENPPPPGRYHFLHVKGDRVREVIASALQHVARTHRGI